MSRTLVARLSRALRKWRMILLPHPRCPLHRGDGARERCAACELAIVHAHEADQKNAKAESLVQRLRVRLGNRCGSR